MIDHQRRRFLLGFVGNAESRIQPQSQIKRTVQITPTTDFYKQSYQHVPTIDIEIWTLTVKDSEIERNFTWDDLRRYPTIESMRTIASMGNSIGGAYIGNAVWKGVRIVDLLGNVTASPFAKITALDGYETTLSTSQLLHPDTFLAYEMNGASLAPEHGYPVRLMVGGAYGVKMPKWISQIEFIDHEYQGFWESRGWSNRTEVQTHSMIFSPHPYEKLNSKTLIQGIAFAGYRDIISVEVRIDGGEWIPTTLIQGDSPLVWTNWYLEWTPSTRGKFEIEVRATDSDGFTQVEEIHPLQHRPNSASAIHKIVVEVV